jgi:hypothetical protein
MFLYGSKEKPFGVLGGEKNLCAYVVKENSFGVLWWFKKNYVPMW